ncbi:MAG: hypothetical protein V2J65_26060, partial [Desulfobacteraceae bacterium]|nr:hypothetical protein [Desulfobacteraceae bacterium]
MKQAFCPHFWATVPSWMCKTKFFGDRRLDSGWVMVDDANPDSGSGNQLRSRRVRNGKQIRYGARQRDACRLG